MDDWKRFEKNNLTMALNMLHTKEKEILPAYNSISKLNVKNVVDLINMKAKNNLIKYKCSSYNKDC